MHQPAHMSAEISDPGRALALWTTLAPHRGGTNSQPVRATFITALDGAVTAGGKSAGLGTDMDQAVYHGMRARAGTILVGAVTAKHEGYGPASVMPGLSHLRTQSTPPALWLLTRTLRSEDIDYVAGAQRPGSAEEGTMSLVVPEEGADPSMRSYAAENQVDVVLIPGGREEYLSGVVDRARRSTTGEIDCEGGPHLLEALLRAELLDELVLSVSPHLFFPSHTRLLPSGDDDLAAAPWSRRLRAVSAFTSEDGGLYTRWIVEKND